MNSPTPASESTHWKKPFFTVWTGQAFSLFGSNLVQFALIWHITAATGSATILAIASMVGMLPQVLLGPFAGALVDRWNRRLVIMVSDAIIALFSLLLAILFYTGTAQIWQILVIMAIRSLGGAFHWPAMQASTSLMVPHSQLARIAGMNQALMGTMGIVAPPLGALLLSFMPVGGILLIDVSTAAIAIFAISLVRIPQPARLQVTAGTGLRPLIEDMKIGFRYIARWPGLLALGGLAMIINFLVTPAFSLIPILVTRHFGGEAIQLGIINSSFSVGFVIGGLALSAWGGFKKKIYTSFMGLAGMGIGIMIAGSAPSNLFYVGLAGMAIAGIMNPIANGPLFAIFQASIAPEMQGRVLSLISSTAGLISPLSLLVAGPIADALGIQTWYWIAAIACILLAGAGLFIPAIMSIEEQGKELSQTQETNHASSND
jgi:MFS transporter, DHA3 family, macrolide efflux protein